MSIFLCNRNGKADTGPVLGNGLKKKKRWWSSLLHLSDILPLADSVRVTNGCKSLNFSEQAK
jgi:hypothetical protein